MVFQEADLSVRVARDIFSGEFEKAIVDDEKQHHRLQSFFNRTGARAARAARVLQGRRAAVREVRRRGGVPVGAAGAGWTCRAAAT
jgi:Ribonuclease G/E